MPGPALLHREFKRLVWTWAVHKPGCECRAHQNRSTSGPCTLDLWASVSPLARGQWSPPASEAAEKKGKHPYIQAPMNPPAPKQTRENSSEVGTHGSQASLPALPTVGAETVTHRPRPHTAQASRCLSLDWALPPGVPAHHAAPLGPATDTGPVGAQAEGWA